MPRPTTGPENYAEAADALDLADRAYSEHLRNSDASDLAPILEVIAIRLEALAHAQLATAAALTHTAIGTSPKMRAEWAGLLDPTGPHATLHPAEG